MISAREEDAGRAQVYDLLSRLFSEEMDAEALTWLRNEGSEILGKLAALGVDSAAIDAIEDAARDTSDDRVLETAKEYVRLFEAHNKIYPFASCWIPGAKPRVLGPRAASALKSYKELGLGLDEEHLFRADHVGTELAFLSVAASKMAQAPTDEEREAIREVFVRFLENDVLVWMPQFFEKVAADPRASFYRAVAVVAKQFLAIDASVLGLVPQED